MSLTPVQIETLSIAANQLNSSDLSIDKIFQLFSEWQSNKQRSVKRLVLSLGAIISLLFIVGGDLTSVGWIDEQVTEDSANIFLISLLIILLSTTYYLFRIRDIDLKVRRAKIKVLKYGIDNSEKWIKDLDEVSNNQPQTLHVLLNTHAKVYKDGAIESYLAIKFYNNELKQSYEEFSLWQKLEWGLLVALVFFSSLALILTVIGVSIDNIISFFSSCQSYKNT